MTSTNEPIPTEEEIKNGFKFIQDEICKFLITTTGGHQQYSEDKWDYTKGSGGGISRVWEGKEEEGFYLNQDYQSQNNKCDKIEKGGVNFSYIVGSNLPSAAATQFKIAPDTKYIATGVSLVIHPYNPNVPTIHMNVRYFEAGDVWWFGGGVDLTPVYPKLDQVVEFHSTLKKVCDQYGQEENKTSYALGKAECDSYFFLPHRGETRGVGGLFFDHLKSDKAKTWKFIYQLGLSFIDLYKPFLVNNSSISYDKVQREYQLYRRSRYVEFNLLFDRGTKFGILSEGRTESILMSLPAVCKWKYNYKPEENTPEANLLTFLRPRDWLNENQENKN
ncbi:coproporphyrinogen III oxidase [Dictyostelium discoideum AX4]|uniref:Oxygen-dependent coproporphyrinogen-III oxidase n=1 Tax=Dictyostelium discoideum TaxID=44689 RepID=HEM6_DICDI|nr:coproporphyrinogen III oxidase [Dictyostelium discoideum AX4]Q54IA7.1 RecName: Full=Oxygen-dependent coproporphyrinogen-III oxidase; Short=Coprogen oxidase; Short=Coproporphyrinogenase [Dictyostelium discoideum]EAL62970.1 coproporphyrinogen III oxidase [Dictyostelium discoideum AX4]|eukprot:XP_636472.1 coproporphyrinogen III oxidase [Dictyostelium discoideum AX4]